MLLFDKLNELGEFDTNWQCEVFKITVEKAPIDDWQKSVTLCNSRLLKSHMRLKKNRPYNHWLMRQGHYLLCFSTSNGRSKFGSLAT